MNRRTAWLISLFAIFLLGTYFYVNREKQDTPLSATEIEPNKGDSASLDDPSDCLPMITAAEGGGPEKVKLPNTFANNTWMISFSAYFDLQQSQEFNKHKFIGLFYDSGTNQFFTKNIDTEIVSSGLIDSEDEQYVYRWPIPLKPKQSILFAFDNPWIKQERSNHKSLIKTPCTMEPGKSLRFESNGYNYLIRATDQVAEITGAQNHSDYTLVLRAQRKTGGPVVESLLSYIPWFDDAMVSVLYVGDLDGDNLPDVIIDNPYKYTESNQSGVLFLSSRAKVRGQVVPVSCEIRGNKIETTEGQFIFYGC